MNPKKNPKKVNVKELNIKTFKKKGADPDPGGLPWRSRCWAWTPGRGGRAA